MAYGLGGVDGDVIEALPGEAFAAGELVGIKSSDGKLWKADATAATLQMACGIAQIAATAAEVTAAEKRIVVIRRDRCDGVTGLTPGATLYVGKTPGTVTTTVPAAAGDLIQPIGQAISATKFLLDMGNCDFSLASAL